MGSDTQPMSVLISSSPPLSTLFIDRCQDNWTTSQPSSPFSSPQLVRKSGKKQTYLPQHKRQIPAQEVRRRTVVFADSVGLPLTQIKLLKNEDTIPLDEATHQTPNLTPKLSPSVSTTPGLTLNFPQPRTKIDFIQRVKIDHVSLENVVIDRFKLTGTVLVHNIDFEKSVNIRYTKDYWLSHIDIPATYDRSIAADIDKFRFQLQVPEKLPPGARLEFCVVFRVGGVEFWDNNNQTNYQIECKMLAVKTADVLQPSLYQRFEADQRYFPPFAKIALPGDEDTNIYY